MIALLVIVLINPMGIKQVPVTQQYPNMAQCRVAKAIVVKDVSASGKGWAIASMDCLERPAPPPDVAVGLVGVKK